MEGILKEIAAKYCFAKTGNRLGDSTYRQPSAVRDYLESEELLAAKEKKALAAFYGLMSETGSHPYIAEKDQARLLRFIALTFSQFCLLRLQGALAA
jgi:hypothetical protein